MMKLRWFWVGSEKVLRYSSDGTEWHDVPTEPRPEAEATPAAEPDLMAQLGSEIRKVRAKSAGPLGAKAATELSAARRRRKV